MSSKRRKIEDYDRVLVVEGYSDLLFYAEILELIGKHDLVFIKELNGVSGLEKKLEDLITPTLLSAKTSIAFIFDGDNEPESRRGQLEGLLSRLLNQAVRDGVWTGGNPNIGLFVVPGGDRSGEIETLVWDSWANDPNNAAERQCIENYVACMRTAGKQAQSAAKGLIGALLAVRSDDDPRLGPGARDNVFDLNRAELEPLRTFLSGI